MTPTTGELLDLAQLAVALPTIIWAETIPSCPAPSSTNIDGKGNSTSFEILVKYKGDSDFRCIHTENNISKSTSPIQLENLDISGAEWIEFKAIENVDEGHLNGNVLMIADAIVG